MRDKYNIYISTAFGLESVVRKECEDLGFKDLVVSNGKVEFIGTQRDIVKANLWLRSAERVYIKLMEFEALTFDDIYDNINNFDWENYLSENGKYIISGKSVKSKLYSISDNQSITKKAIIDRLGKVYQKSWFMESEEQYKIRIALLNDIATVTLDTSGSGLHKRGYRTEQNEAPIKESLAAALILLSKWDGKRDFIDLFCGSGTIPIEAALIAKNIAPGISRKFDFMNWPYFDQEVYRDEKIKAYNAINDNEVNITGFDIDPKAIEISKNNAINAGVDEDIKFVIKDVNKVGLKNNFAVVISNPPYGERMGDDREMQDIYKAISKLINISTTLSFYFITSDEDFERNINYKCDQKRKLFNGRIEVNYYQYHGPDPLNLLEE
ncbi:THUMP domain-containing class I SAM-dependent RNA methyltransferase [Helcococcus kunzii]|uniref:THUMP domain-containing class I SAM-dependent RNA methyltransferase n=1 Tax=Helcococcus kunzii TaxID=40091 RepID=UPI0021A42399|nr:class I SAM-dependent RNA methyltransferase [Helcococcus kunzii]MCT1796310.1 class I SAM-dependent RNA methyltransferase [Helcococcus kunzii]MCT1988980.1 class I SAM-dependent RNA methyltransferase [Helcococcus kunzii]